MNGCLLIHGFTGSPHEIEPIAETLRDQSNWVIDTPTLPGHGAGENLKDVHWTDWMRHAERSYRQLARRCDTLYLVGFSMGSLIAAGLAARHPTNKLVLLSPAVFTLNLPQLAKNVVNLLGKNGENGALTDQFHRYKEKLANTPIQAVLQYREAVKALTPELERVDTPVLIIHGTKDDLTKPESARFVYEQVRSKEKRLLWLHQSSHMICHDREREKVIEAVTQFFGVKRHPAEGESASASGAARFTRL